MSRPRKSRARSGGDVYHALADPHRRKLLDLLFATDGRTLTDLDAHIPEMTRFGVMKHLAVLERARLITTRKVGREKLHYLNPVPIRQVYERWVSKYTEPMSAGLVALQSALEGHGMGDHDRPKHVYQILIRTTPARLWRALTDPEMTAQFWYRSRIHSAFEANAPYHFTDDEGRVPARGVIVEAVAPKRLVMTWELLSYEETAPEPPSRITWEIAPSEADPHVCVLTVVHDQLDASPNTSRRVANGWPTVLSGLKTLLETGSPLL